MQFTLSIEPRFYVYAHFFEDLLIYIGSGTLSRALDLQQRNHIWANIRDPNRAPHITDRKVTVQIWFETPHRAEARVLEAKYIRMFRPYCNIQHVSEQHKTDPRPKPERIRSHVKCVETGAEYQNTVHASQKTGVSATAISNCLNGRKGYEKVKGMTFIRCPPSPKAY